MNQNRNKEGYMRVHKFEGKVLNEEQQRILITALKEGRRVSHQHPPTLEEIHDFLNWCEVTILNRTGLMLVLEGEAILNWFGDTVGFAITDKGEKEAALQQEQELTQELTQTLFQGKRGQA